MDKQNIRTKKEYTVKKRETSFYYIFNGKVFSRQSEIVDRVGFGLGKIRELLKDGVIEKYQVIKGYKLYCTPHGKFKTIKEALEAEPKAISRQAMYQRFKSDSFNNKDYYIEQVDDQVKHLNYNKVSAFVNNLVLKYK